MKRYLYIILAALLTMACMKQPEEQAAPKTPETTGSSIAEGKVIVVFSDEIVSLIESGDKDLATKAPGIGSLLNDLGVVSMERVFPYAGQYEERTRREGFHRFYKLIYKADVPVTKAMDSMTSVPGILHMEPVHRIVKRATFNDPMLSKQWHYINQRTPKADIHVQEVWENYTVGSSDVIVCVVDESVDPTHPDLQANLWKDADGHTGYNFTRNSYDLSIRPAGGNGDIGHGTHVAGTIAAVNNNGVGLCGIAGGDYAAGIPGVRIMSTAIFSGTDQADDDETYAAIKWSADNGAVISQNSWGYSADEDRNGRVSASELASYKTQSIFDEDYATIKAAIDYFIKYAGCDNSGNQLPGSPMKGGLFIAAAGNEDIDHDIIGMYDPVISVGAYGPAGARASYSNYGSWIDIGAPGGDGTSESNSIWSTLPKKVADGYGGMINDTGWYGGMIDSSDGWAGTSMACPHVSGVAALLISYFGGTGFTADMCKEFLLEGATENFFSGTKPIGKKLDALGAFQYGLEYSGQSGSIRILINPAIPAEIHAHASVIANVTATSTEGGNINIELQNAPSGVSFSDGVLRIDGPTSASGFHSFAIKATNAASGASATKNIRYTILQNHAPEASGSIGDMLFPTMGYQTVSTLGLFSDPDGETPTVTAASSNPEILKVQLNGNNLTLIPMGYGDAVITVTGTDLLGLSCSLSFKNVVYDAMKPAQAYPQQVQDDLTVRISSEETRKTRIRISTTSGAIVYNSELFMDVYSPAHVDMSKCAPGIYTVAVTYSGKTSTSRVVKL
ncbi:MAG: S8 family serine peptidase [Bacteroidales bacterium]|nr:S8 family serine peptidase [Bacteroidales bacterium]